MAVWQYDLHLIPRPKLIELFGGVPEHLDSETFNLHNWWQNHTCRDYEMILGSFLGETGSWSQDIRNWGSEDGNYISVICDDNQVVEISVRLDVRTLNSDFISNVCRFSKKYDCVLLTENSKLIEPEADLLLTEVSQSDVAAFVLDPIDFLNNTSRKRQR